MANLWHKFFSLKRPEAPPAIEPGLYHYLREADGAHIRFHLRVEPDGRGLLLANAAAAARLSPSGVFMVKGVMDGASDAVIKKGLAHRFTGMTPGRVEADLKRVKEVVAHLATPDDNYPIINLDDPHFSPHQAQLMAPLRADLPLASPEKIEPVLRGLWEAGIPHAAFLAPSSFDPDHLVRAVELAEDLGMISGVRGRAGDLAAPGLLANLARAGVDHLTVLYLSADPGIHDPLCGPGDLKTAQKIMLDLVELEICPVAEIALVEATLPQLDQTLAGLSERGITNVSFFALAAPDDKPESDRAGALSASALPQAAALVEELSHEAEVRFLWQPPVARNTALTLAEQILRGPRCSGDVSIRVEPDGGVVPPRGPYKKVGNIISDPWPVIWGHDVFRIYREKIEAPARCDHCPGLVICDAACPRDTESWSQ